MPEKRKDLRPARNNYWARKTLQKHKVRNLIRHCGMTPEAALRYWLKARRMRVKRV